MSKHSEILIKIKKISIDSFKKVKFTKNEENFLFDALHVDNEDVINAALLIIIESNETRIIDRFLKNYDSYTKKITHFSIPLLASTDNSNVFTFLLSRLKQNISKEETSIIVHCLAYTHFPIIPKILSSLLSDDTNFINHLKQCLSLMNKNTLLNYLATLPFIPHEKVFHEILGESVVKKIKQ